LMSLNDANFDMQLTGFDEIDIDKLLTNDAAILNDEPEVPNPPDEPVTRYGDVWQIGPHRIVCGDSREREAFALASSGFLAAMVFTDPPYNVPIAGNVSGNGRTKHQNFAMASGEMSAEQFRAFLECVLGNAKQACDPTALHYVCMDWRGIGTLSQVGATLYEKMLNLCVWVKPNGGMGTFYRSQHELVAVFQQTTAPHTNNIELGRLGRNRTNVWQYAGASSFSKARQKDLEDHPTVKPVAMVAAAIRDATIPNELVLDPFGGAGTTLLAAHSVGRYAGLIEIDPKYVDVIITRFRKATGTDAVLVTSGLSFDEVRRSRGTKEESND
jgi:DNA modification methylase